MRRAAKVDANHAEIVKALRQCGVLVLDLSRVGQGCPDLLACRGGMLHLLEVKHGTRGRLTPGQFHFWAEGWPVRVITDPSSALMAVGLEAKV